MENFWFTPPGSSLIHHVGDLWNWCYIMLWHHLEPEESRPHTHQLQLWAELSCQIRVWRVIESNNRFTFTNTRFWWSHVNNREEQGGWVTAHSAYTDQASYCSWSLWASSKHGKLNQIDSNRLMSAEHNQEIQSGSSAAEALRRCSPHWHANTNIFANWCSS